MPNDHRLRQRAQLPDAFCNTSMCSPSRATLLTGQYPAQHGVTLTHTRADLRPGSAKRRRRDRNARRHPPNTQRAAKAGDSPVRPWPAPARSQVAAASPSSARHPNLAQILRGAGYEVAYKGKWHLTHPTGDGPLLGGWGPADAERLRRDYGFADWDPPDAGENTKAEHFGAGNAGPLGYGWDELYTRQAEAWLDRPDLPEPFCLVVSLVNPHDVLGYPANTSEAATRDRSSATWT